MSTPMESQPRRHRIMVDEYLRMAETGVLAPDARVELIEGEIIDMAPMGVDHGSVVAQLNRLFVRAVGDDAFVWVQSSVRLGWYSMPEPDLAVLAPRRDFYRSRHPVPADMLLLIEVSDSSLRHDRDVKVPLYARHEIPEVWIFDLQEPQLLVCRSPVKGAYQEQVALDAPGIMPIALLPGVEVDLSGVLVPLNP